MEWEAGQAQCDLAAAAGPAPSHFPAQRPGRQADVPGFFHQVLLKTGR